MLHRLNQSIIRCDKFARADELFLEDPLGTFAQGALADAIATTGGRRRERATEVVATLNTTAVDTARAHPTPSAYACAIRTHVGRRPGQLSGLGRRPGDASRTLGTGVTLLAARHAHVVELRAGIGVRCPTPAGRRRFRATRVGVDGRGRRDRGHWSACRRSRSQGLLRGREICGDRIAALPVNRGVTGCPGRVAGICLALNSTGGPDCDDTSEPDSEANGYAVLSVADK